MLKVECRLIRTTWSRSASETQKKAGSPARCWTKPPVAICVATSSMLPCITPEKPVKLSHDWWDWCDGIASPVRAKPCPRHDRSRSALRHSYDTQPLSGTCPGHWEARVMLLAFMRASMTRRCCGEAIVAATPALRVGASRRPLLSIRMDGGACFPDVTLPSASDDFCRCPPAIPHRSCSRRSS